MQHFWQEHLKKSILHFIDRTLIRLESESTIELLLEDGYLKLVVDTYNITCTDNLSPEWKHVRINLQPPEECDYFCGGSGDSPSTCVTVQIGNTTLFNVSINVPTQFTSVAIGEGFNGLIQDVGIDTRQPSDPSVAAAKAVFLPQCLCSDGYSLSTDELNCTMGFDSFARYVYMHY